MLKPLSPDVRASVEPGSPSGKVEKVSGFASSAFKLKQFIADVNQMANRQSEVMARKRSNEARQRP